MKDLNQIFDEHNLFITDRTKFRLIFEELLEENKKEKAKQNNPNNIDDDYRWGQSDMLDELKKQLGAKSHGGKES